MQDVYVIPIPAFETDLAGLEIQYPGITRDYELLTELLETHPLAGLPFDHSQQDLWDVRYTDLYYTQGRSRGERTAIVIFLAFRDRNAFHVQPLAMYQESEWSKWSLDQQREAIRARAFP